jgi:hypothetical protein
MSLTIDNMFNCILPENFFSTLKDDVQTISVYRNSRKINMPTEKQVEQMGSDYDPAPLIDAAHQYNVLENKAYAAANRIFGAVVMVSACVLGAFIILPVITSFSFCAGLALCVATFVVGKDLFKMSKIKEEMFGNPNLPPVKKYDDFILSKHPQAELHKITEPTQLRSFWNAVLLKA